MEKKFDKRGEKSSMLFEISVNIPLRVLWLLIGSRLEPQSSSGIADRSKSRAEGISVLLSSPAPSTSSLTPSSPRGRKERLAL